jgi:SH3-like domain-containing protein
MRMPRRLNVCWFAFASTWTCVGPLVCAAQTNGDFPYTATVVGPETPVHSGPGQQFYATDKLSPGTTVEVYRQDPGGWLAIRPPDGSFTWVQRKTLKTAEHAGETADAHAAGDLHGDDSPVRLAIVTADRAAAYVGSRLTTDRDVAWVRLRRGEVVEVLGDDGAGAKAWCRIAPPAGEFRWVQTKDVRSDRLRVDRALGDAKPQAAGGRDPRDPTALRIVEPAAGTESAATSGVASADATTRTREIGSVQPPAGWESRTDYEPDQARRAGPLDGPLDGPFDDAIARMDVELSFIVAREPALWRFDQLRRDAESLLARSQTDDQRNRIRFVLGKLERFDRLGRDRNQATLANQAAAPSAGAGVLPGKTPALGDDPRFDGAGRLTPFVSKRPDAPQYALSDESNRILMLVSPAPGVNLPAHVGHRVGLQGVRGYHVDLQADHLTAQRITLLDAPQRR